MKKNLIIFKIHFFISFYYNSVPTAEHRHLPRLPSLKLKLSLKKIKRQQSPNVNNRKRNDLNLNVKRDKESEVF